VRWRTTAYSEISRAIRRALHQTGIAAGGALLSTYKAITPSNEPETNSPCTQAARSASPTDDAHKRAGSTLATISARGRETFSGLIEPAAPAKHNTWESLRKASPSSGTSVPSHSNNLPLPSVSFVVPDQNDDMHDGHHSNRGDTWMQNQHPTAYAQWAKTPTLAANR